MESRKTHLINDKGEKLVVDTRDLDISQQNGDGKYDEYYLDVDWYLVNGYSKAEDMFKRIEEKLFDDGKNLLTIEEAEKLTIEKVKKIYENNGKL